jgi:hypothetical protein
MTIDNTPDITPLDPESEALLRARLHDLAGHAPTTVRAIDEVAVRRAEPGRRYRRAVGIAASVAALVGAGTLAFVVSGRNAVAGAASPDAAVTGLVTALRNEDILGAIDLLDPAEVAAIRPALDRARDTAEQVGVISDELSLDKLQGLDIEVTDLQLSTEELAPDLAVVTPTSGSLAATFDPAAFPLGADMAAAMGSDLQPVDAAAELGNDLTELHIATVRRGDRWYVSLQYSVAEQLRTDSDKPFPAEPPVVPVGADTPELAAEAFYGNLVRNDAAGLATSFAPGEGDVWLRYAALWVPALQGVFDESFGAGGATLSGLELEVDRSGSRVRVTPTAFVLEGTVDPQWNMSFSGIAYDPSLPTLVMLGTSTTTFVWLPAGVPIPATAADLAAYEVYTEFPDSLAATVDYRYNSTYENADGTLNQLEAAANVLGQSEPFRVELRDGCVTVTGAAAVEAVGFSYGGAEQVADDAWRHCSLRWNGTILALGLGFGGPVPLSLPTVGLVEVDGAWYLSPLGTIADGIVSLFEPTVDGGGLFDSAIGSGLFGFDRSMLEDEVVGLPLDQAVPECRDLLEVDADGIVTGMVDRPDPAALGACRDADYETGWTSSSDDLGIEPEMATETTILVVEETPATMVPQVPESLPATVPPTLPDTVPTTVP